MVGYWKLENIKLETQMQKKKKKAIKHYLVVEQWQ